MRRSASLCVIVLLLNGVAAAADLLQVDYRKLVSRADLDYTTPATRSEEGQPIGNGRMGSLVWTTPSALHFQINRVDVFGQDSYTTSFPKQDSDYASGCGYVDINLVDAGEDVFAGEGFKQHLSLYDALMTARGAGVTARVVASPLRDVIAIEIDDQRDHPAAVSIDLRMLRYAIQGVSGKNYELAANHTVEVHTAEHIAASKLDIHDGRIVLTQDFSEHNHYSASAVAIAVVGRESRARYLNESTVQLCAAAGKGKFTILISSAASLKKDVDVASVAIAQLAAAKSFDDLAAETAAWWHDFWSRGFVHMHSADSQADFVEANYTYFLYIMACCSRGGAYPPRFGGLLFYTNGDMRRWGSQYWWANTQAYYSNLMPANRMELMEPMFAMYSGMLDSCALAAKQQWGAQGIWIPEITFFNGPEKLPDDIAAELQELVLARKPYEQRSARFQWWAETKNRHNSRWNFQGDGHFEHGHFVVPDKGGGIFGHCTHILADAARIGNLYYQRYLFTRDKDFLRDRAYPIVKGAAEFYRTFPNVKKGDDGKYHIHHVNNNEGGWDTSDTQMEIAGMRTAFTLAIRASTILDVDADLRPKWQEVLENLAPASTPSRGRRPATTRATTQGGGDGRGNRPFGAFVYGGPGAIPANDPEAQLKSRFLGFNALGSFIDPQGIGGAQIFRNRLRLREGPGAIDCEHLGGLVAGIHSTLLDNAIDAEGNSTIEVFTPVWPRSWDCGFELLAHGGFVVTSSLKNGQIDFVQVRSPLGGACRMKNPWPAAPITLRRGEKAEKLSGDVITFDTARGEVVQLLRSDRSAGQYPAAVP
jgi:hypothetical protein